MNVLAIAAGIGGLELGIKLAMPEAQVLAYVERDAYCASVLLARMEDKALEPAPIFCGDIRDFDAAPFAGVDLVTAGYPCQPFSVAGKQAGMEDERHIWPEIARIVRDVRPSLCFFENVANHLNIGFREVCEDLWGLGYGVEAGIFSAEEVGAPHLRKRLFILAHGSQRGRGMLRGPSRSHRQLDGGDEEMAYATQFAEREPNNQTGTESRGVAWDVSSGGSAGARKGVAHANGGRFEGERLQADARIKSACRDELDRCGDDWPTWPPGPKGDWSKIPESAQPSIRRVADGIPDRVESLRTLGNAVVPVVAAYAFRALSERAGI